MKVPADAATQHARVTRMLQEFGATLRATTPGSSTMQTWAENAAGGYEDIGQSQPSPASPVLTVMIRSTL